MKKKMVKSKAAPRMKKMGKKVTASKKDAKQMMMGKGLGPMGYKNK